MEEIKIKINDYIEGYEYYGHIIKKIKGWVDDIKTESQETVYYIQADDGWHGARGTTINSSLGKIRLIMSDAPRVFKG